MYLGIEHMYDMRKVVHTSSAAGLESPDVRADLARRFDALHELIYRRGGIRPVNAAIDELCKLLFLRVHIERHPNIRVDGLDARTLFEPAQIRRLGSSALGLLRRAFDQANADPEYNWRADGTPGFFIE